MADIKNLVPIIFRWEGGWADVAEDKGGKTNMGVTLSTWKSMGHDKDGDGDIDVNDLRLITKQDVVELLRKYWNRWQADRISNQSIANFLVDWVWNSGVHGIKIPQKIMGLKADGIVGPVTMRALNGANAMQLFEKLQTARLDFIEGICERDPKQLTFRQGWINRITDFKYKA